MVVTFKICPHYQCKGQLGPQKGWHASEHTHIQWAGWPFFALVTEYTESNLPPLAFMLQPIKAASCSSNKIWTANLCQSMSVRSRATTAVAKAAKRHMRTSKIQQNVSSDALYVNTAYCGCRQMVLFALHHANNTNTDFHLFDWQLPPRLWVHSVRAGCMFHYIWL